MNKAKRASRSVARAEIGRKHPRFWAKNPSRHVPRAKYIPLLRGMWLGVPHFRVQPHCKPQRLYPAEGLLRPDTRRPVRARHPVLNQARNWLRLAQSTLPGTPISASAYSSMVVSPMIRIHGQDARATWPNWVCLAESSPGGHPACRELGSFGAAGSSRLGMSNRPAQARGGGLPGGPPAATLRSIRNPQFNSSSRFRIINHSSQIRGHPSTYGAVLHESCRNSVPTRRPKIGNGKV